MKKGLLYILTVALFATLSACGGSGKTDGDKKDSLTTVNESSANLNLSAGEAIYKGKGMCLTCHGAEGLGTPGTFPPLANADYLMADKQRAVSQTLYGASHPITVNGTQYPGGVMGATVANLNLTDQEVVDVVNYVLNSWGNKGGAVTVEMVQKARQDGPTKY